MVQRGPQQSGTVRPGAAPACPNLPTATRTVCLVWCKHSQPLPQYTAFSRRWTLRCTGVTPCWAATDPCHWSVPRHRRHSHPPIPPSTRHAHCEHTGESSPAQVRQGGDASPVAIRRGGRRRWRPCSSSQELWDSGWGGAGQRTARIECGKRWAWELQYRSATARGRRWARPPTRRRLSAAPRHSAAHRWCPATRPPCPAGRYTRTTRAPGG